MKNYNDENKTMKINIVLPVLNEELRLEKGLNGLLDFLEKNKEIVYEITIVDNGSTDATGKIARRFCAEHREVNYIRMEERGVGAAFRKAVACNTCEVIGYTDIDLSTELSALKITYAEFSENLDLDMVNASRYHKKSSLIGRKWYRNLVSYCLVGLLKFFFRMKATDAICGFKFFRKEVIERLLKESGDENGWFLLIEVLLRAERSGCNIRELPVTWVFEEHSKVRVVKVTFGYLKQMVRLAKKLYWEERGKTDE